MQTFPHVVGVHQDGQFVFVNPAGARLLGAWQAKAGV
jgi:hypothetical protein